MEGKNEKPVRLGKKLKEKLKIIKEAEERRGHKKVSFASAGEILAQRIDSVGGLKEEVSVSS
jgi:hypothetical protein